MTHEIETKKKSRKVLRTSFTRAANELEVLLSADTLNHESIEVAWELLLSKYDELKVVDIEIYELLVESATEAELETDVEGRDGYFKKFTVLKVKYNRLSEDSRTVGSGSHHTGTGTHSSGVQETIGRRKFKLPRIEFKHYDGSVKDWLSFWAQFRKIHEDDTIDNHDKIEYLVQATVPGSRARQLVDSYPAMSENYGKIVESMQSRFGREDLQIEVYVRELLKLILTRSASKQKMDIATLYDQIETQLRALETLGITSDKCSAMLFPLIESCLPNELLRVWQRSSTFNSSMDGEEETSSPLEARLKKLMLFLRQEVESEQRIALAADGFGLSERMSSTKIGTTEGHSRNKQLQKTHFEGPTAMGFMNCEAAGCVFCTGSHDSDACFKAQKMTHAQKRDALSGKKACFRCLKIGHQSKRCRGRLRCVLCTRSHVALMCPDLPANKNADKPHVNSDSVPLNDTTKDQTLANRTSTQVFLQTLRVTLKGANGIKVIRALIDSGSQRSYILKETAIQLGYHPKRQERIVHCLFGGSEMGDTHNSYDVTICNGSYSYTFEALDQLTICGEVTPVFYGPWIEEMRILNLEISDVQQPGPIELLLGADVAGNLYTGGRRELRCGLVAIETRVGWTLMGKMPTISTRSNVTMTTLNLFVKNASISDLWELDVLGIKEPSGRQSRNELDRAAKDFFQQTTGVNEEGRYEVRLPWLEGHPPLTSNHSVAKRRLDKMLAKLQNDGLVDLYDSVFQEWLAEGVIEEVDYHKANNCCHYLPHRPVIKESSSTTKIRPVFDASAREKNKPSLNQCLEKGPNLIELIPSILLRFREKRVGVVSDICKAFLQISVHKDDRDFLRFLWIDATGNQLTFRHKRVVFGVNSSPFLLGATIELHLSRCLAQKSYAEDTVKRLGKCFYVDNCVTSVEDETTLQQFIKEASSIMQGAKFDLRGWEFSRNSEDEIEVIPVLGLRWDPGRDVLSLSNEFLKDYDSSNVLVTKRLILSLAQRVFDPIGYACPATLIPKLLLQRLWKTKLTWDQPVDTEVEYLFRTWLNELNCLWRIKIPRWVHAGTGESQHKSLHVFCDASKDAFACVIFLRVVKNGTVSLHFIAAKSRVAPLRLLTLPRLELMAATIGARLYSSVMRNLEQEIESYFWSDSSTVLSWIQRNEEWNTFVWNRVNEIRELTSAKAWRHVPGVHNPADLPSRGCMPKKLLELEWWEGPAWLREDSYRWPLKNFMCDEAEISEEKKKRVTTLLSTSSSDSWHFAHFFQYQKIVRMMAWVQRFVWNLKHSSNRQRGELSASEFINAEHFIHKVIQAESFAQENEQALRGLPTFKDENGLIRLKSRVSRRDDTEDFRFPVVLPAKHLVVRRLIFDLHKRSCHVGVQGLLSLLRENYWILGGRRTVRSAIAKCVLCKRQKAKPFHVEPPPLPVDRVRDARVFEVTGVDLAGPLHLKNGDKSWICLFSCAVYRAVHLELLTSLSTACFMQALRRFVARRGRPTTLFSDNGTNFVGTENAFSRLNWGEITRETSVQRITWRFNPPTAAWWGGFWERLVGVLKQLLRKILGRALLSYEDLITILCDCEYVVNSRPLTYTSNDASDLVALTPAMFLNEKTLHGVPELDTIDRNSMCRKLRHRQVLIENLRKRFRSEYLGQLKLLYKSRPKPIEVGNVVLVGDENVKRLDWPLGRVAELLPGKDGVTRVVKVETAKGQLMRPIQRLFPLEIREAADGQATKEVVEPKSCRNKERVSEDTKTEVERGDSEIVNFESRAPEVITRSGRVSVLPSKFRN